METTGPLSVVNIRAWPRRTVGHPGNICPEPDTASPVDSRAGNDVLSPECVLTHKRGGRKQPTMGRDSVDITLSRATLEVEGRILLPSIPPTYLFSIACGGSTIVEPARSTSSKRYSQPLPMQYNEWLIHRVKGFSISEEQPNDGQCLSQAVPRVWRSCKLAESVPRLSR